MTKSTITRERLAKIKSWRETYGAGSNVMLPAEEAEELARIALAAMDSEPVAWTWHYREQWHVTNDERRAEFVAKDGDVAVLPLYRHAQSAQISEPVLPLQDKDLQGVIDALEHPAGINAAGKQVVRHALVEIQERHKADREPVAEVVSIYGDPEAFGEREIRPLVGIQQMPYGTKLYRHVQQPVVESEPVALQPELAKVIYHFRDWNEGFPVERFKADYVISWMLANYPPAPPAQPAPASMEDHQIRELVNELRDISIECHGTQQLRERIARTVRAAMLNGGKS
ncbi:TPA: hypothetical protein ACN69Q_004519 [Klebsiella pneumoniae]